MVSEKLKIAVKLSPKKAYEIAHEAGILPCTLSKILLHLINVAIQQ